MGHKFADAEVGGGVDVGEKRAEQHRFRSHRRDAKLGSPRIFGK